MNSDWNRFVAASPYGDVLQCREWGEVKKPESQPVEIALQENGVTRAQALVLKRALPGGKSVFYLSRGPILDWSDTALVKAMFAKVREEAAKHNAALIKVDPCLPSDDPAAAKAIETLREVGFIECASAQGSFGGTQPRYNMKLDISQPLDDVMMNSFHQKWRYNVRLGAKKGLVVQTDCTRDDLKTFHDIYKVTAERDGFTGYSLGYFQKMWDALVENGLAKLFLVHHDGKVLSGAISFLLPPQCWYVFGASSNEGRNLMPNHSMQWAMMQWAKENGCTVYDFRGVHDVRQDPSYDGDLQKALMESSDGLVKFKAGFGAQLVEYIGEWDWPLDKKWYWVYTKARPAVSKVVRKMKGR